MSYTSNIKLFYNPPDWNSAMGTVRRPHERVTHHVHARSSRNGAKPRLIVVHSTQGQNLPRSTADLKGLGNYFDREASQESSSVGVDSDGYSALYVPDVFKPWTQSFWNPWSLSIEFIGIAEMGGWTEPQYNKGAQYIAYWSKLWNIPIRKASVSKDGRILKPGIIRHSELGVLGGNHRDPGEKFNLAKMNSKARVFARKGW